MRIGESFHVVNGTAGEVLIRGFWRKLEGKKIRARGCQDLLTKKPHFQIGSDFVSITQFQVHERK